jgi:hypothetical protein
MATKIPTNALEAIASFPNMKKMYAYCKKRNIYFDDREPPYLTMARIASVASDPHFQGV